MYDPGSGRLRWEAGAPLPEPRYDAAAAVYRDRIYLVGGYEMGHKAIGPVNTTFIYSSSSGKWLHGPTLQIPRYDHHLVVIEVNSVS